MSKELRFNFSENLKALRKEKGLTQLALAQLTRVDYKYIQKMESKDPPNVSLKVIERLAVALKIKPAKLFE
jgi:transcriptional regulator with XRE-family HTH domain